MALSTEQLQTTVNLCRTHIGLQPIVGVGGFANEPAMSLCNSTMQELLASPYGWKFNRIEMPMLVTAPFRQDFIFAGASAFTLGSGLATGSLSQGVGIGLASNSAITVAAGVVTVNTLQVHNFSVGDTVYHNNVTMTTGTSANYNSVITQTMNSTTWSGGWVITAVPSATSYSFAAVSGQNNSDVGGAPSITDFGWLESATMVEMNNTSPVRNTRQLKASQEIQPTWQVANPDQVCVLKDNGDGTLKVRFSFVPGTVIWGANLVYQAKAPLKVALTDTWAPFPDEYGFVYRQMFLATCWRYINDQRQVVEFQKAQQMILKALGRADAEATTVHIAPQYGLLDW